MFDPVDRPAECETAAVPDLSLEVQLDHIETLARAEPWNALVELIWNSLDAEATEVDVTYKVGGLLGDAVDEITVRDNGHGFGLTDGPAEFGRLGGSWKAQSANRMSLNKRVRVHGALGRGRFKAFALGDDVVWTSTTAGEPNKKVTVSITRGSMSVAKLPDADAATRDAVGTTTVIFNTRPKAAWLLRTEDVVAKLSAILALHLRQYPGIKVTFAGEPVDPRLLEDHTATYPLAVAGLEDQAVELEVIEWKAKVDRALHLCDADGFSLEDRPVSDVRAPTFNFTAYIRWDGFREVDLFDFEKRELIETIVAGAKDQLRDHFRRRAETRDSFTIQTWKDEQSYPFEGEPQGLVEEATRDLFDITALTVNASNGSFARTDVNTRRLTLRLLREAVERSPDSLATILEHVGKLDRQRLDELAELLEHTALPKIIAAGRQVTARLVFIEGLSQLVFDHRTVVNERDHLHRILEQELWVFGDQWREAISEKTLTNVLRHHLKFLGRDDLTVVDPVATEDGNVLRRVDLMLSGVVAGVGHRTRQHLVVELKSPGLKLNDEHLSQIRKYARAVAKDQRFADTDTHWEFWLIGSDLDEAVIEEAYNQADREPGVAGHGQNYKIYVKRWSQILDDNRRRLEFMKTLLETDPGPDEALAHLRRTHASHLPQVLLEADDGPASADVRS